MSHTIEDFQTLQRENDELKRKLAAAVAATAIASPSRIARPKLRVAVEKGIPFPNQREAAKQILRQFTANQIRYVLLKADVQSGKTGVYQFLIQLMFEANMIDQAYIVCGSHETELLKQCENDVHEWQSSKGYWNDGKHITVVFRQRFERVRMITKRTLIICDETHLVAGVDQTLNQFMIKHGLTMAGTNDKMKHDDTYIVSVDATPFAEESVMAYKDCLPKGKVVLENGDGYYGPEHYYSDGLVQPTWDLCTDDQKDRFKKLLASQNKKYVLIRVQEKKNKQHANMMACIKEVGCKIVRYTSKFNDSNAEVAITREEAAFYRQKFHKDLPCLEVEPQQTTVVLIDGRLRCGKRVSKKFIGFVWESSTNANTDTIIQGLFGRMCGYDVGENKPLIFIPVRILARPKKHKVVQQSELERYFDKKEVIEETDQKEQDASVKVIAPRFGSYIEPGRVQNQAIRGGRTVTQCVPIRLLLSPSEMGNAKFHCLEKLNENKSLIIEHNSNLAVEQKQEILACLESQTVEGCHIRNYQGTSNQNMHKRHVEAYNNNTASKEHIDEYPFLTFCITYDGFQPMNDVASKTGEVFAIIYTEARGFRRTIDKESRIAHHTGKSQFSMKVSPEMVDCPAASVYGFSPQIRSSSTAFETEFNKFIQIAKEGVGMFMTRFESLFNGEFILLPRSVYGDNLEVFNAIRSRLENKHNVKINFQVKKRYGVAGLSDNLPDHAITYIRWENK